MDTTVVEDHLKFNLKAHFQNFIYSFYFPLAVAFFTVFIYFTKMQLAGCFTFTLFAMIVLITQKDVTPILPPLFNVVFLFYDLSVFANPLAFLLFLPMAVGIIFHLIKYPPKKNNFGLYGLSLIAILFSLILGGLFTNEYLSNFNPSAFWFGEGISLMFGIGLGIIVEYIVLKNGICLEERKNFDFKLYISYAILFSAITVALQLLLIRALGKPRDFGWGNINFCGYVFMLAIPSTIYLLIKTNHVFTYLLVICCLYAVTCLSGSDGALGTIVVFTPILIFYAYTKIQKNKKIIFLNSCCLIVITITIVVIIAIIKKDYIIYYINMRFFNDTGRSLLFNYAITAFKENPVFGQSVFYPIKHSAEYGTMGIIVNYHSSIFNTLATTGIFGLCALIFNYIARFKILTKNNCLFNCCAYFSIAMYVAYSSIDHGEVSMLLILVTGILVAVEKTNLVKNTRLNNLLEM